MRGRDQAVSFISLYLTPRNVFLMRQRSGGADVELVLPSAGQTNPQRQLSGCHSPVCGTWGTYGALLSKLDTARYKFFVLLNSSVRGPFLPSYIPVNCCTKVVPPPELIWGLWSLCIMHGAQALTPWHRLLTLQLTGEVHLLGPVLSCQASLRNDTGQRRSNPYVPADVVAMDQVMPRPQVSLTRAWLQKACREGLCRLARRLWRCCTTTVPC